ncbi:hypothetical protein ACVMB0_000141 [Bradyrhizobium sp. USDA 4451]
MKPRLEQLGILIAVGMALLVLVTIALAIL